MKSLSRVVWSEGMHLAQHHFQQQSRYFEERTAFALSLLFADPYGFAACVPDAEAMEDGTAALSHARGVMPDGTPFNFPPEPLPKSLDVASRFGPTEDRRLLLLCLPPYRATGANWSDREDEGDGEARFRTHRAELPDETTGTDVRSVDLARKNFGLALDGEAPEDWITLPLARIRRDGAGSFAYDADFVPPVLQIGASPGLLGLLGRLEEVMEAKARSVESTTGGARGRGATEYGVAELTAYWMLHTIHSSLPVVRHHLTHRSAHPEQAFNELARMAGALCTFSMESRPEDLPTYRHEDLEGCFGALERHIRSHLDVVLPTGAVEIPLEPTEESFFEGSVPDPRFVERGSWYLGVEAEEGRSRLPESVPRLVKICSGKHIVRLVRSAHPALPLTHLPSPPSSRGARMGAEYFRIEKEGPCWESITKTRVFGVYLPSSLSGARLELKVIPDSGQ